MSRYSEEEKDEQKHTYDKTLELFKGRCAFHLSHQADCVHEIEPRSHRPKDWWALDNRIPLCGSLHEQIHREGWRNWVETLRAKRSKALRICSPDWVQGVER